MSQVALQAEGSRPASFARRRRVKHQLGLESGQGLVEYALILIVVSVAAIFLILTMGSQLNNMFSNVVAGFSA